jgi:soluble P-type ATPase
MIRIEIPNREPLVLQSLFLDMNGTLTLDGELLPGVAERVRRLGRELDVYLITAGTFGNSEEVAQEIGAELISIRSGRESAAKYDAVLERTDPRRAVAVGNGANDVLILRHCALGIAVIGPEGAHAAAISNADVVCSDIGAALDLLLNPKRLAATLRG